MTTATLAGTRATSVRLSLPAARVWHADVSLDGEVTHAPGAIVELVVADLKLTGCIMSGGPHKGRSHYRVAAGKGGWGKTIPAWSYQDDAGVRVATILADAAKRAGETLGPVPPSMRVGTSFVRQEGPAARVLEQAVPGQWHVDEAGVTHVGRRLARPFKGSGVTVEKIDRARATVRLATDKIADLLPGAIVEGIEAVDVEHELSPDGLRTTIWGAQGKGEPREVAALRKVIEQIDPHRSFRGVWEYRVATLSGKRLDLQPQRVSTGMPVLQRVPVRPGVAGCEATLTLGARVLVTFIDSDPSRPCVVGFDDPESEAFTPIALSLDAVTVVRLADGERPMPATGDLAGGIWPIVGTTRVLG